jgi:LysM repeat protein
MSVEPYLHKIRKLTLWLFASGACNILLAAFLFFWLFRDRPPVPYCELKPKTERMRGRTILVSPTNADLIKKYKGMGYQQLLMKLGDTHLVEDGFTERDIALGVLTAFYDFNLEKALGKQPLSSQKRVLSFNNDQEGLLVYARLTDEQFAAIHHFASTERWPFKAQGLFFLLKKEQFKEEDSLKEAFYLTTEFTTVAELFLNTSVKRETLIELIQEGNWGLLATFAEKQKKAHDLSAENRQRLLLSYVKGNAKSAATILLTTDFDFAMKRLSDSTVMAIMRLLDEQTPVTLRYVHGIATSPRADQVRTLAIAKYQELSGKSWEPLVSRDIKPSQPKSLEVIALKPPVLTPHILKKPPTKTARAPKNFIYIVQEGDSLWKIAKRFSIPIEEIRALNNLRNDCLKPGSPLKVPDRIRQDAKDGTSKVASK